MKKDYIVIAGDSLRVEANWNALTDFLEAVGRNTIDELAHLETIRPTEITALMAACINEGERLDGRETAFTARDLGAIVTPANVREFLDIYVRQSDPQVNAEKPKKEPREEHPAS